MHPDRPASPAPTGAPVPPSARRGLLALAGTLVVVLPVAMRGLLRTDLDAYDVQDERLFHGPTIARFAEALPTPDLSDYPSATGPLYHLLLAPLHALTGGEVLPLRLATLGLAVALLGCAAGLLSRRSPLPAWSLGLLLLPLGLSPYFLGPAVRLSTDDTALLFVVASLWAADAARSRDLDPRALALAAVLAAAAVWTRQVHGWLVGALGLLALLSPGAPPARRIVGAGLATLPVLAFLPLVMLWGGPMPPSFAEHSAEGAAGPLNLAVLQTELAVLGAVGIAYGPWLLRALGRAGLAVAGPAALVVGAALLWISPLPWVDDPLRFGGSVWKAAGQLPDLGGTTALFWGLVPLGLLWLGAFAEDARRRRDLLPVLSLCCFLAANMASARAYQKYYEPFLLLALAWLVARQPRPDRPWWWLGPAALALVWAAVAAWRFVL